VISQVATDIRADATTGLDVGVEVTVVVPTYRRDTRLAFTLEALAEQTLDPSRFEVLVIRDEDTPLVAPPPAGLDVRFITQPAPGPALRRNRGWQEARGSLIAFTDDDCRPAPGWLEALLEAHVQVGPKAILGGRTEPDPDEAHLHVGLARSMQSYGPNRWYPTCNLAMPRAMIESLGGFDPDLAFWGEDTDLGLRAEENGAELVYVDEAIVWHAVHIRTLGKALRDATERHADAEVLARHPSHRDELYLGLFISEDHALITAAAMGVLAGVLTRRPKVAALGAYPYVIHKLGARPLHPKFNTPLGFARFGVDVVTEALVDGTEVAMRLRTSIRKRALVL